MGGHKGGVSGLNVARASGGHRENALEDSKDSVLIPIIPIAVDLGSDVRHEVHAASHIIGEIGFSPAHHTAIGENTLFKGISLFGGEVRHTIIVLCVTADQTEKRQDGVHSASLSVVDESFTKSLICDNRAALTKFVQLHVGNSVHVNTKSPLVETLCIEFAHLCSILSLNF